MDNPHRFLHIEKASSTDYLFHLTCGLFSSFIFAIDIFSAAGIGDGVPYVTVVLISIWSPRRYFTVFVALCSTLLTIIGFLCAIEDTQLWQILPNRIIAILTIWGTAFLTILRKNAEERREKAIAEREKALADVKILRGFLPICASCKKIRDDQGYWSQIEDYIVTHSEADLSHGICPTCARSLYPDLYI